MSGKEFLKDLKEGEGVGYAIMMKPKEENPISQTPIPTEVQNLLDQFKDIICDGSPPTLPPKRAISHQIDFIPRATLCNKAAYRMTLEKKKEMARQVTKFLDQGLIRKSISICVVLMVLTPKKGGKWRMCTDSRAINRIIISYRFLIPKIEDLMDCLGRATCFSKIDLKSGYY